MQKIIAKYGLAAHLALVAVAPLFLFPYFGQDVIAVVLLWMALVGAVWTIMEPSVYSGESPHQARLRTLNHIVKDQLFWIMLVVVVATGIRAFNDGIKLAYDIETASWSLSGAAMTYYPATVPGAGFLPFATAVTALVLLLACRHALGRSARMTFLLISSVSAGLAALIAVFLATQGNAKVLALMNLSEAEFSYVGIAFGLYLLCSIVALVAAFERKWNKIVLLFVFGVGGTVAGLFAFTPGGQCVVILAGALLMLMYSFAYTLKTLRANAEFRFLTIFAIMFVLGVVAAMFMIPEKIVSAHVESLLAQEFVSAKFAKVREVISAVSFRSWTGNPWIGSGIGSIEHAIRFSATQSDWAVIVRTMKSIPHGWWFLLVERGIVGAAMLATILGALYVTYVRRAIAGFSAWFNPGCLLAPIATAALVICGFYDCSFLRSDVMLVFCTMLALSAASFPKRKKG